ncbi:MAG TPA: hypothetical protein VFH70_07790, partial [Acidimicrobiales bacterium]|nr:hypothetical protein [Acidimicrobiales bacterium]
MPRQRRGDYWGGRAVQRARAVVATWLPAPCGQGCGREVTEDEAWVIGHIKSRAEHPELTWEPTNWRPEHRSCSDRTGQSVVIARARAAAGSTPELGVSPGQPALFPTAAPTRT